MKGYDRYLWNLEIWSTELSIVWIGSTSIPGHQSCEITSCPVKRLPNVHLTAMLFFLSQLMTNPDPGTGLGWAIQQGEQGGIFLCRWRPRKCSMVWVVAMGKSPVTFLMKIDGDPLTQICWCWSLISWTLPWVGICIVFAYQSLLTCKQNLHACCFNLRVFNDQSMFLVGSMIASPFRLVKSGQMLIIPHFACSTPHQLMSIPFVFLKIPFVFLKQPQSTSINHI